MCINVGTKEWEYIKKIVILAKTNQSNWYYYVTFFFTKCY